VHLPHHRRGGPHQHQRLDAGSHRAAPAPAWICDKNVRDTIGDSIQDWRDANEQHRLKRRRERGLLSEAPGALSRTQRGTSSPVTELLHSKGSRAGHLQREQTIVRGWPTWSPCAAAAR
jgi:hypothetical protein